MEPSEFASQVRFSMRPGEKHRSPPPPDGEDPAASGLGSLAAGDPYNGPTPTVFLFNPFAEGYIARGKAFTPVKHQATLAEDLSNLAQFLCRPHDIVVLPRRPSAGFLSGLGQAGFPHPEFVELRAGWIGRAGELLQRRLGGLRPWAWGPDSVRLFAPLFGQLVSEALSANQCFNDGIAQLYSKAWSAGFLRKILARCRGEHGASSPGAEVPDRDGARAARSWLCSEEESGTAVDALEDALEAIASIRRRGHPRVVVKESHGLAGHNAIRLWEPEVLPAQRQWLARALRHGRQVVVEPWLERALDYSVQLEMGPSGLTLCGYTGLVNDRRGQFLANWAEDDHACRLPANLAALFPAHSGILDSLHRLYSEIFNLLEVELQRAGFVGPVSIDAFVYRTPQGQCRLKPVVEINPRYTMGRLTVELMRHTCAGRCGLFRLVSRAQARRAGFEDLSSYARCLVERAGLRLEGESAPRIREGALCLNDPARAQECLATFEVRPALNLPDLLRGIELEYTR